MTSIRAPDSMRFVPIDFARSTLADGLRSAGFRDDGPAFFAWLGVTVYLDSDAVFDTLRLRRKDGLRKGGGFRLMCVQVRLKLETLPRPVPSPLRCLLSRLWEMRHKMRAIDIRPGQPGRPHAFRLSATLDFLS